ncbi:unnamed protein product [Heterobilharzia americana]|nr:unnamed protein product [Heterobilharzia americana]
MGRSKQSLNNSAAKSPQPGVTPEPKNKRLTNGKTTPLKPGSKRPVPVGSDDSGSDIETGHVTDLKMSHKKLKLGDTKLEPEKHEIESEEDEDDEVEDDDEDDDDEDDDDEDDEDDTGDDDDEEDEDDDESEEGKTPKNLQAGFSPGPKVMVLGFQGNPGHLRKEFPTCIDVQYDKNKKKAILKFPSLEVRQAAVSEPKFINGRKLKLSLLGGPELKTAMILGVSTDVKESEIKGLFDGVVSVTRDSTSSGNHQQPSITVEFKTATDCEKAISSNATLNGKRITIFLKGIFVDEVSGKKPETIAGLKQDEPPAKRAKAAAVVPGSGKLKVEVLGEVPKVEEISSVEDDDEEEDDDEDESEESDDSDDDDVSESDSEEENEEEDDVDEEGSEDVPMASPKARQSKQLHNTQGKKPFEENQKMNNRPGGRGNFRGQQKFGGDFKHNSQRGHGGQPFRGRGGQSPRGRGGQSFRGRGGNRGGWFKRGDHNKSR